MIVTGEQFNIICCRCILGIALASNQHKGLYDSYQFPSWYNEEVHLNCMDTSCPHLLSVGYSENEEFAWRLMTSRKQSFGEWWQDLIVAYDKLQRKYPNHIPKRPDMRQMRYSTKNTG